MIRALVAGNTGLGETAFQSRLKLAELGFVDALGAQDILRLVRRHGGADKAEPGRILERMDWALTQIGHLGRKESQVLLGSLYGEAIWRAWCLPFEKEVVWHEDEAGALATALLGRAERIDARAGTAMLEQVFHTLAGLAAAEPAASFPQSRPIAATPSIDTRAGRMWTALQAWAGPTGRRSLAVSRGLRQACLTLDDIFPSGGPPPERSRPLLLALQAFTGNAVFTHAPGALAVLSTTWNDRPLRAMKAMMWSSRGGESREIAMEKILEVGARTLSASANILGEDTAQYPMPLPDTPLPVRPIVVSEALLLRADAAAVPRAALQLAALQGPHDGRAYARLKELAGGQGSPATRREIARAAVLLPFRLVREDPAVLAAWTAYRLGGGFPQTIDELRAMLSEPGPLPGDNKSMVQILRDRTADAWKDREDLWELIEQVTETPGLPAAAFLNDRITHDVMFSTSVANALFALAAPEEASSGNLALTIVFLRGASARRPIVGLADEGMALRAELPKILATLVRQMAGLSTEGEMTRGAQEATGPTLGDLEGGLLRLCGDIVKSMAGAIGAKRDSLWITYRLYQWFCAQLGRLQPDERAAGLRALADRLPPPDIEGARAFGDALHLGFFDKHSGFDHRLATVLYAITVAEELWPRLPEGPRRETVRSVSSPLLEDALVQIAARPSNEVERHLRSLGDRPSQLDWIGPIAVPDLALLTVLTLRRGAFFDLKEPMRLWWLTDLPSSQEDRGRVPWVLASRIFGAVLETPARLSREERVTFERWLRGLRDTPGDVAPAWRRRGFCALYGAGAAHLSSDARAALLGSLDAPDAAEALADYLHGVARIDPVRLDGEVDAALAQALEVGVDPLSLIPGLGRLMTVSRERAVIQAASEKLRALAKIPPYQGNERMDELLATLGLR